MNMFLVVRCIEESSLVATLNESLGFMIIQKACFCSLKIQRTRFLPDILIESSRKESVLAFVYMFILTYTEI